MFAAIAFAATRRGLNGPTRIWLCFVGFAVAVTWVSSIVNEIVGCLQTIGYVFHLSDAIIGLTVFAMGNSLGDLVANLTIARMGFPSMACVYGTEAKLTRQALGDLRRAVAEHPSRRRRQRLVLRLPQRQVVQDTLLPDARHH